MLDSIELKSDEKLGYGVSLNSMVKGGKFDAN
jgi:hypothetical protein